MSNRKVLFIVEGSRAEPRFLNKMHQTLFNTKIENIYHYGTVIFDLLERLFLNELIDEDLDVVSVLREKENNEEQRAILKNEFSDIYLVFDMDPHHQKYNRDILKRAMQFFNDSTQNGKLYLNYPMLESFKHLKEHEDFDYLKRVISIDKNILVKYKSIVEQECYRDFKQLEKYTVETFTEIIQMNLKKNNLILYHDPSLPRTENYLTWKGEETLSEQMKKIDSDGTIYVLNTSIFIPVDYNPSRFCMID